jgi:hypothetical protein
MIGGLAVSDEEFERIQAALADEAIEESPIEGEVEDEAVEVESDEVGSDDDEVSAEDAIADAVADEEED